MIKTWRILTGRDKVDPSNWFTLQGDQAREGTTSTRGPVTWATCQARGEERVLFEQGAL